MSMNEDPRAPRMNVRNEWNPVDSRFRFNDKRWLFVINLQFKATKVKKTLFSFRIREVDTLIAIEVWIPSIAFFCNCLIAVVHVIVECVIVV